MDLDTKKEARAWYNTLNQKEKDYVKTLQSDIMHKYSHLSIAELKDELSSIISRSKQNDDDNDIELYISSEIVSDSKGSKKIEYNAGFRLAVTFYDDVYIGDSIVFEEGSQIFNIPDLYAKGGDRSEYIPYWEFIDNYADYVLKTKEDYIGVLEEFLKYTL
jgi:flagellar hook-associated protein FlgK